MKSMRSRHFWMKNVHLNTFIFFNEKSDKNQQRFQYYHNLPGNVIHFQFSPFHDKF